MWKDFSVGCLALIAFAILVPLAGFLIQVVWWITAPLMVLVAVIFGLIVLGRVVRLFFEK